MPKSLASARGRNGARTFKWQLSRGAQASQPVRGEKTKIAASRKFTYSPTEAEKALLNDGMSSPWCGDQASRSSNPCTISRSPYPSKHDSASR